MSATPLHPQVRLALSRTRLRLALQTLHAGQDQAAAAHAGRPAWWEALRAESGTRVLLDTLSTWWSQQPWHKTTAVLAESAKQLLRPAAQRNPLALILGAAALGGALVLLKPWRWLSVPALAAGLLPPLVARVFSQLRPLSWADLLNSWLQTTGNTGPKP
jgi:hypothetical protein